MLEIGVDEITLVFQLSRNRKSVLGVRDRSHYALYFYVKEQRIWRKRTDYESSEIGHTE